MSIMSLYDVSNPIPSYHSGDVLKVLLVAHGNKYLECQAEYEEICSVIVIADVMCFWKCLKPFVTSKKKKKTCFYSYKNVVSDRSRSTFSFQVTDGVPNKITSAAKLLI